MNGRPAGIALPGGLIPAMGGQPMQPPPMVLATPFNDVQLLGMMAAQIASTTNDPPEKVVRQAADLLFEAIVESEKFGKRIADYRKQQAQEAVGG